MPTSAANPALVASSGAANPALETILADYQRYHAVLVVVSSLLLLGVLVLLVACWRALRTARRRPSGATRRERWTYRLFMAAGVLVGLFLLLVIAANVSTVLSPERGFAGVDQSGEAIASWLSSRSAAIPPDVQERIDARLAWQRPKAIIVTLLLIGTVAASIWIWRRWIPRRYPSRGANAVLLAAGLLTAVIAFVLMLMVMGNTQAAIAPVAITLVLG